MDLGFSIIIIANVIVVTVVVVAGIIAVAGIIVVNVVVVVLGGGRVGDEGHNGPGEGADHHPQDKGRVEHP